MISSKLKKKIDKYNIISFDIFDTALFRNTSNNTEVFDIIEKNLNISFSNERKKREDIVKKILNKKSVSIQEIYSDGFFDSKIMNIEIDVEKNILQANKEIQEVYNYALKKRKKVIFISDMYMDEKTLSNILKEKGYKNYYRLFVSSEYNMLKSDGTLFRFVVDTLKCNPKDILHIGDSIKSDFISARKVGLNSFLYKRKKNKKVSNLLERNILNEFCYNNLNNNNYFYKFGYEKYGILLYSFSLWLNSELNKLNIKKVYFLSRDGYILKKAFEFINIDKIPEYLYVSRRSLTVPNLWKDIEFESLENNIIISNYFTIKTFLKRLGLNPNDYKNLLDKYNLKLDNELSKKTFLKNNKLKDFYNEIKKDITHNSKNEYNLLQKYLKQNEFYGNVAIVDIGWHGTMQKKLLDTNINRKININGFYLGQEKIIKNANGFLFNEFDNALNKISIAGSFGFFESLFLANHGSVIKYKEENNKIVPVLDEYEFTNSNTSYDIIKNIQQGAIDFCKDFSKNEYMKNLDFNNAFFDSVRKVCINPSLNDVNNLGQIMFNDTYNEKLIDAKNLLYYVFHLSSFKKDFYKSVWKIGFLKKVFKIKIPFFKIYYKYKRKETD